MNPNQSPGDERGDVGGGHDEAGQGLAEYALILALIATAVIGALIFVGTEISDLVGWQLFEAVREGQGA